MLTSLHESHSQDERIKFQKLGSPKLQPSPRTSSEYLEDRQETSPTSSPSFLIRSNYSSTPMSEVLSRASGTPSATAPPARPQRSLLQIEDFPAPELSRLRSILERIENANKYYTPKNSRNEGEENKLMKTDDRGTVRFLGLKCDQDIARVLIPNDSPSHAVKLCSLHDGTTQTSDHEDNTPHVSPNKESKGTVLEPVLIKWEESVNDEVKRGTTETVQLSHSGNCVAKQYIGVGKPDQLSLDDAAITSSGETKPMKQTEQSARNDIEVGNHSATDLCTQEQQRSYSTGVKRSRCEVETRLVIEEVPTHEILSSSMRRC